MPKTPQVELEFESAPSPQVSPEKARFAFSNPQMSEESLKPDLSVVTNNAMDNSELWGSPEGSPTRADARAVPSPIFTKLEEEVESHATMIEADDDDHSDDAGSRHRVRWNDQHLVQSFLHHSPRYVKNASKTKNPFKALTRKRHFMHFPEPVKTILKPEDEDEKRVRLHKEKMKNARLNSRILPVLQEWTPCFQYDNTTGRPVSRMIQIDLETGSLQIDRWSRQLAEVTGLAYSTLLQFADGRKTGFETYNEYGGITWLGFTILFLDEHVNVVFHSEKEAEVWFLGLQNVVPLSQFNMSRGVILWYRLMLKLQYLQQEEEQAIPQITLDLFTHSVYSVREDKIKRNPKLAEASYVSDEWKTRRDHLHKVITDSIDINTHLVRSKISKSVTRKVKPFTSPNATKQKRTFAGKMKNFFHKMSRIHQKKALQASLGTKEAADIAMKLKEEKKVAAAVPPVAEEGGSELKGKEKETYALKEIDPQAKPAPSVEGSTIEI